MTRLTQYVPHDLVLKYFLPTIVQQSTSIAFQTRKVSFSSLFTFDPPTTLPSRLQTCATAIGDLSTVLPQSAVDQHLVGREGREKRREERRRVSVLGAVSVPTVFGSILGREKELCGSDPSGGSSVFGGVALEHSLPVSHPTAARSIQMGEDSRPASARILHLHLSPARTTGLSLSLLPTLSVPSSSPRLATISTSTSDDDDVDPLGVH